jgi:hypothetical protein
MTPLNSPIQPDRGSPTELLRLILNAFHRTIVHYAHWWQEVEREHGLEECIAIEQKVWPVSFALQMKRLAKVLGFEVDEEGIPAALKGKSAAELRELLDALSVNWLANDGIWFQAVENTHGMETAKVCNDAAWSRFSPFEAGNIQSTHELPDGPPLLRLASALHHRLYAHINDYTLEQPDDATLILRMNTCRVQVARERKGLDPYPCKSGGLVEYATFAYAIDPSITIECIGCPPDPHPDEWYCAWKFSV